MKLGILAWEPGEAESVGIAEAGRERGHETVLFEFDDIGFHTDGNRLFPTILGEDATTFDVLVSRGHVSYERWRENVEALQMLSDLPGVLMLDPAGVHVAAVSKFTMLHRLSQAGIRVPPTRSCRGLADFEAACRDWGQVVLKPSVGYRGTDVERFVDGPAGAATEHVADLLAKYGVLLCQPYYPHDGDLRVLVIGDEPSVCTKFHTGGRHWKPFPGRDWEPGEERVGIEICTPAPRLAEQGVMATKAMGLSLAGVDIIEVDGSPMVIEVNVVPGWGALKPDVQEIPNKAVVELVEQKFGTLHQ